LRAGDVDLVLTDGTAGNGYVAASGGTLKIVGQTLGTEDFGFIFPKGSDLVAPVKRRDCRAARRWHAGCVEHQMVPGNQAGRMSRTT